MALRYALRCLPVLLAIGAIPFRGLAQGDTCTTALQVISGAHLADGPTTGYGVVGACGTPANNGDWYRYTPAFTGTIIISSCHPLNNGLQFDTYLRVFTGDCDNLVCMGFNDDMGQSGLSCPNNTFASYLEVSVNAGQDYFIVWADVFSSLPFTWELNECVGTAVGATYTDTNSNGTREAGEPHEPVMLLVQPGNHYVFAGNDPYSFCTEMGAHTITVPTPPQYYTVAPVSQGFTIAAQGDQITGMDFGFQPIPGIYDGSVNIWGWNPWIGNNTQLNVQYANVGTEPITAQVILELDPLLTYVSASLTPTNVSGGVITWNVGTIATGASASIAVTIFTPITVPPNAPVGNGAEVVIAESDENMLDNSDHVSGNATTSFDPNEKLVDATSIDLQDVADQRPLEYTVHFQNEGTAPAVNIVIKDSLDADWDLATFEMVDATHPYTLTVNNEVAIWTFANIMLPTSDSDEPGSHGGFHYRVAPKTSLIAGDELTNRADIYFDYNAAVLTNTTVTTVELNTGIEEAGLGYGLSVSPSPSDGLVNIRWSDARLDGGRLSLIDALGRTVLTMSLNSNARNLDLSFLPEGGYVARLTNGSAGAWTRFVIALR